MTLAGNTLEGQSRSVPHLAMLIVEKAERFLGEPPDPQPPDGLRGSHAHTPIIVLQKTYYGYPQSSDRR